MSVEEINWEKIAKNAIYLLQQVEIDNNEQPHSVEVYIELLMKEKVDN